MALLVIAIWWVVMTVLPATLLLLLRWALVRPDHTLTATDLKFFMDAPAGNLKKGEIPHASLTALTWLREPASLVHRMETANVRAGMPFPLSGYELYRWLVLQCRTYLMGIVLAAWLGFALLTLVGGFDCTTALIYNLLAILGLSTAMVFVFTGMLSRLARCARERDKDISRSLPFVIDFLVMIMASGGDFTRALQLYLDRGSESALKREFFIALQEMRAGEKREVALQRLAERSPLNEIRRLVLVMVQADRTGTPMVDVLRKQSLLLRMERTQKATEIAEQMNVESRLYVGGMIMALMLLISAPFIIITLQSASRM